MQRVRQGLGGGRTVHVPPIVHIENFGLGRLAYEKAEMSHYDSATPKRKN